MELCVYMLILLFFCGQYNIDIVDSHYVRKNSQISEYNRTKHKESNGVLRRHSLCFLLSGLPFPAFSLFILTSAKPQVQHFVSMSKETSLKTPSFSDEEPVAAKSLTYFTNIGLSLNLSSSCGIRTTLSTPGDETYEKREMLNYKIVISTQVSALKVHLQQIGEN